MGFPKKQFLRIFRLGSLLVITSLLLALIVPAFAQAQEEQTTDFSSMEPDPNLMDSGQYSGSQRGLGLQEFLFINSEVQHIIKKSVKKPRWPSSSESNGTSLSDH